jgi:hypothetical protein
MKKLTLALAFFMGISSVFAQQPESSLKPLLDLYYDIKNSLVKSDAPSAATKAAEFVTVINAVDEKKLSKDEGKAFSSLKQKLAFDARHISENKEVSHQRDHFKTFSDNFYLLIKDAKVSGETVYRQYCPMKKSYWLSNESSIKNPYYGSQMLTCGKVTDTLK